jgi:hypothetical protein
MVSHRRPRRSTWWRRGDGSPRRWRRVAILAVVAVTVATGAALTKGLVVGDRDPRAGQASRAAPGGPATERTCHDLTVLSATSYRPVLTGVAPLLAAATPCVRLRVVTADGRAALDAVDRERADAWVADDSAWRAMADPALLARSGSAGEGGEGSDDDGSGVVAVSPIYLLTTRADAASIGPVTTWEKVADQLASGSEPAGRRTAGLRLAAADPDRSGAGLVGLGSLAEAVWLRDGMDESTVALTAMHSRARTYSGAEELLVPRPGQVAVVPEYVLLPRLADLPADSAVLAPGDRAAMLRYTWMPTARGVADPARRSALGTVLSALRSSDAAPALRAAGLRPAPTAADAVRATPSPTGDNAGAGRLPALAAAAFPVLGPHHADHVLAAWNEEDRKADVLLVIDVSGSMADPAAGSAEPLVDIVTAAAQDLTALLPDDATLGTWVFGSRLAGAVDHLELVAPAELSARHRGTLRTALAGVRARRTGTGLYDTVLNAYVDAAKRARAGVPAQVVVFTDGRDEDDPASVGARGLRQALERYAASGAGPRLTVIAYGTESDSEELVEAVEPVDGYVEHPDDAAEVRAAFIHAVAGGLQHPVGAG